MTGAVFSGALRLARPFLRRLEREALFLLGFLKRHYTPLSVLVLAVAGVTLEVAGEFLFRYSHWNYWLWRSRAASKAAAWCALLIALKLLLGGM